jgi:hypothetical protein
MKPKIFVLHAPEGPSSALPDRKAIRDGIEPSGPPSQTTAETLAHGLSQRSRSVAGRSSWMTDNGAAMKADEVREGLAGVKGFKGLELNNAVI